MSSTKEVKPLKVAGYEFPMHSDYFFDMKKTYKESPSRGLNGEIATFPDKFFVPYIKVTYAVITIEKYQQMMAMIQSDEQSVEFYDSLAKVYRTAKFYCQQPTYNKLYTMKANYHYVMDLELIFSGTLANETTGSVIFNMNGVETDTPPSDIQGNVGDNYNTPIMSGVGSWNTSADGTGVKYVCGGSYAIMMPTMTLYAMPQ